MDSKNSRSKTEAKYAAFSNVIPAFLAPDHILERHYSAEEITDSNANTKLLDNEPNTASDIIIRESLQNAVEHNDIDVFMQPIVTLPQRHISFYELYGRLRVSSGVYIPAQEYMPLAANEPMINHLDALLLSHCVKILGKQHRRNRNQDFAYFINVKPSTLRNGTFMSNLLTLLSRNKFIANSLVFEIKYSDFLMLSPMEQKILNGLAEIGCSFSLDHVDEIPTDIRYLKTNSINFIKIAAQTMLKNSNSEQGFSKILSHKHNLEVNGIDLIIEKIETKQILLQILDFDLKYGQGFLLGKPDFQGVYTK